MENKQSINKNEIGSNPLVSVIMPVYNTEKYLQDAVDSILSQSEADFELILIEDCSTDTTREIVKEYAIRDPRVCPIYNDTNLGLVDSLNKGIEVARGRYIARMDGDDISKPDRFKEQINYLEEERLDIVGCQCVLFTDDVNKGKNLDYPTTDKVCKKFLRRSNALPHPAWLGRREVFEKLKYRNIAATEDYDFIIRAVQSGYRIGNAPTRSFCYRINEKGISGSQSAVQNVTARYLAKNYREKREVMIEDFSEWKKSNAYNKSVINEEKRLSRLTKLNYNSKAIRIIRKITNIAWIRQRIIRYRNAYLVRRDKLNNG